MSECVYEDENVRIEHIKYDIVFPYRLYNKLTDEMKKLGWDYMNKKDFEMCSKAVKSDFDEAERRRDYIREDWWNAVCI